MAYLDIKKLKNPKIKLLLYMATIAFAVLALVQVITKPFNEIVGIILYVLAAITFFTSCFYVTLDIKYGVTSKIRLRIENNPFARRVMKDYRYKTVIFAVPGLAFNIAFAIFNGVIGILSSSPWFGTLAAYYILLVIMTIILGGAVVLLVSLGGGKSYPGFTIYAVAAYAFYKITISIMNVIKVRKLKSPLLMAIRDIGYVDACVSILTLQTAMFASFGTGRKDMTRMMNGITGTVVCLIILATGIHQILSSVKMERQIRRERN